MATRPLFRHLCADTRGLCTFATGPVIRHRMPFSSVPMYEPSPSLGTNSPDAVLNVICFPGFLVMKSQSLGIAVCAAPVSRLNLVHTPHSCGSEFRLIPLMSNVPTSSFSGSSPGAYSSSSASSNADALFFPFPLPCGPLLEPLLEPLPLFVPLLEPLLEPLFEPLLEP